MRAAPKRLAASYSVLGVGFIALLLRTLLAQPLLPFRLDDAEWSSTWLLTTVADYYVSTLCLCGVIVATDGWRVGGLWAALCCVLGSAFACLWVVRRLLQRGTLRLAGSADGAFAYD